MTDAGAVFRRREHVDVSNRRLTAEKEPQVEKARESLGDCAGAGAEVLLAETPDPNEPAQRSQGRFDFGRENRRREHKHFQNAAGTSRDPFFKPKIFGLSQESTLIRVLQV